jgi:hypothetical protein
MFSYLSLAFNYHFMFLAAALTEVHHQYSRARDVKLIKIINHRRRCNERERGRKIFNFYGMSGSIRLILSIVAN